MVSPPGAGEGFAPSPECPSELGTSWMQSLCGWGAQILHPTLMSEALDPRWKAGTIKCHHCFPPCPQPLSGRKQLVLILLPTPPGQKQPLGLDRQPVPPWPQLPHLGKAAGLCQWPWGRASPPKAGQCHTATRNDETPGLTHCCSSRHPAALCLVTRGWVTQCPFLGVTQCPVLTSWLQAGHKVSPEQLPARPPCAEQQGRTCPCHHGSFHTGGQDCGEFHRPWAHRHILHRQGNLSGGTTKPGGWNTCLDGGRRNGLLTSSRNSSCQSQAQGCNS